MSNFELIDDYLTNRLADSERIAFEQQVISDPALKADVEVQKNILQGIRKARAAELKTMLNNVTVGSPVSSVFTTMRMAAGIVGAGILITSLYYYFQPEGLKIIPNISTSIQDSVQGHDSVGSTEKLNPSDDSTKENTQLNVIEPKEEKVIQPNLPANKEEKEAIIKTSEVKQPKIEVIDPTNEMSSEIKTEESVKSGASKSVITASSVQVEIDSSSKKYNFHYQFTDSKLQLFGSFDKSLYEILEINGESHAVFMFYRENYYLLDEKQNQITRLSVIKDSNLLKKLKEYRGRY